MGNALKDNRRLWAGDPTLDQWPNADRMRGLVDETVLAQKEHDRLAALLAQAGFLPRE
jgi:hypothetical protein